MEIRDVGCPIKMFVSFMESQKNTLRAWADNDKVIYKRTPGNQRVYFISTEIDESRQRWKKKTCITSSYI